MSIANGRLLASPTTGRLLYRASTGRLIYGVRDPVDHVYRLDSAAYLSIVQSKSMEATQDFDGSQLDYWIAHRNELLDALDAANRPTFNAAAFADQSRYYRYAVVEHSDSNLTANGRRNRVYYTSVCIAFTASSVPDFGAIAHVDLELSCGTSFPSQSGDDFADYFYADGVFAATPNLTGVPDILTAPHFRVNVGDCQRWNAANSSVGYCYSRQSGHATTNDYLPVQTVRVDDAIPYLQALGSSPSTLYLYMAIEGPYHIPVVSGFRRTEVLACPNAIHILA